MSARAFERALVALGVPCIVEQHERLAVLRQTSGTVGLSDASVRERVVALAKEHGFTHVALDLTEALAGGGRTGAAVSGD